MLASMRVMVVTSQKGGSGKTTLSGHIAVEAERRGFGPVALVDADPQGSLAMWWNARTADTPVFAKTEVGRLHADLQALRAAGMRLVVIDTPPAVTATIRNVVAFADLVVIPTRPSPHDLRAVAATLDIVENKDKPFIFVVNGATPRARITAEAAIALSQHGTVAPVTLHHRTDFASSMIDGRTVMECDPGCKSAEEVSELWTYLEGRLAKVEPRPVLAPLMPAERPTFGRQEVSPASEPEPVREPEPEPDMAYEPEPAPMAAAEPEASPIPSPFSPPLPPVAPPPATEREEPAEDRPARPLDRPVFGRRESGPSTTVTGFGRRAAHPER